MGQSPSSETYNNLRDGFPLIQGAADLGAYTPKPQRFTSSPTKVSAPGDTLISVRAPVGLANWVDGQYCLGRGVAALRARAGMNDVFLYYLTHSMNKYWQQQATGTTFPGISGDTIRKTPIVIPPLHEQREIASILGALDDKIELNRRMNTTLEAMARALFQSWFVDFDPVHAKVEGRQPVGMDAATATKFPASFEDSALGPIPTGWDVATLGDVLTTLETGRRPKGGVASFTSGIPSVGAESINGIGVFDYSKTRYIPEDFYERNTSGRVADFDVLLYKDGGKPGEFRPRVGMYGLGFPFPKFSVNEHVFRMRAERLGQPFLYFLVSSHRVLEDFANKGGKAAIPGINQPDVKSTLIVLPSRELLEKYNDLSLQFCERILRYASESQSLSEVRDNLLPQLLSGKLPAGDVPA